MSAGDILLDSDGNRMLDTADGALHLSDGAGDDCCCDPCPCGTEAGQPGACEHCDWTPSGFTVSVSGVSICACLDNLDGSSSALTAGSPNGTYTVTHGTCQWSYTAGGVGPISGSFRLFGSASDCTGSYTDSTPDDFEVILTRTSTTWTLVVRSIANTGYFRAVTFFSATWSATGDICCEEMIVSNGLASCVDGTLNMGYGGTATITPCP